MLDDVGVFDRLVASTWGGTPASRQKPTVAIVLYIAAGLGGALLALFEDGGIARSFWVLFAVVFVMLGVTLAVYHSRRS